MSDYDLEELARQHREEPMHPVMYYKEKVTRIFGLILWVIVLAGVFALFASVGGLTQAYFIVGWTSLVLWKCMWRTVEIVRLARKQSASDVFWTHRPQEAMSSLIDHNRNLMALRGWHSGLLSSYVGQAFLHGAMWSAAVAAAVGLYAGLKWTGGIQGIAVAVIAVVGLIPGALLIRDLYRWWCERVKLVSVDRTLIRLKRLQPLLPRSIEGEDALAGGEGEDESYKALGAIFE